MNSLLNCGGNERYETQEEQICTEERFVNRQNTWYRVKGGDGVSRVLRPKS